MSVMLPSLVIVSITFGNSYVIAVCVCVYVESYPALPSYSSPFVIAHVYIIGCCSMRHTEQSRRSAQNLGQFCAAQYRLHVERNRFSTPVLLQLLSPFVSPSTPSANKLSTTPAYFCLSLSHTVAYHTLTHIPGMSPFTWFSMWCSFSPLYTHPWNSSIYPSLRGFS